MVMSENNKKRRTGMGPVEQLAEALRYKPESRGFDSRWFYWKFLLT